MAHESAPTICLRPDGDYLRPSSTPRCMLFNPDGRGLACNLGNRTLVTSARAPLIRRAGSSVLRWHSKLVEPVRAKKRGACCPMRVDGGHLKAGPPHRSMLFYVTGRGLAFNSGNQMVVTSFWAPTSKHAVDHWTLATVWQHWLPDGG